MKPGDVIFIKATVQEVQPDGMILAILHLVRQMVRVPVDAVEIPNYVADTNSKVPVPIEVIEQAKTDPEDGVA